MKAPKQYSHILLAVLAVLSTLAQAAPYPQEEQASGGSVGKSVLESLVGSVFGFDVKSNNNEEGGSKQQDTLDSLLTTVAQHYVNSKKEKQESAAGNGTETDALTEPAKKQKERVIKTQDVEEYNDKELDSAMEDNPRRRKHNNQEEEEEETAEALDRLEREGASETQQTAKHTGFVSENPPMETSFSADDQDEMDPSKPEKNAFLKDPEEMYRFEQQLDREMELEQEELAKLRAKPKSRMQVSGETEEDPEFPGETVKKQRVEEEEEEREQLEQEWYKEGELDMNRSWQEQEQQARTRSGRNLEGMHDKAQRIPSLDRLEEEEAYPYGSNEEDDYDSDDEDYLEDEESFGPYQDGPFFGRAKDAEEESRYEPESEIDRWQPFPKRPLHEPPPRPQTFYRPHQPPMDPYW